MSLEAIVGVLVTVAIFMLAQTGAFIWWASGLTTSVRFIQAQLSSLGGSVLHEKERLHGRIDELETRLRAVEQRPGRE